MQNSQKNICARISVLMNLKTSNLQFYQKRESSTSLVISAKFLKTLFYKATLDYCFCHWSCCFTCFRSGNRSNCLELFYKKGVLENFSKFRGQQLCGSLFLTSRIFSFLFLNATLQEKQAATLLALCFYWRPRKLLVYSFDQKEDHFQNEAKNYTHRKVVVLIKKS